MSLLGLMVCILFAASISQTNAKHTGSRHTSQAEPAFDLRLEDPAEEESDLPSESGITDSPPFYRFNENGDLATYYSLKPRSSVAELDVPSLYQKNLREGMA